VSLLAAMFGVLLDLAPFLLLGMAVAGVLHVVLPDRFVHRQLRGRFGVVKAVLLGVPLPLCSCGVIPTGLGLRKDGASRGASVGFLISTPQTGVDSAVTGLFGGLLADAVSDGPDADAAPAASAERSTRNVWKEMVGHALEILRTIWRWVVVGIAASALITTFVPDSVFQTVAGHGQLPSVLLALVVSLPLYVCATASVPIAAALVAGGFPAGAALVFLMAGPATNVATIGAIRRFLGGRALAAYLFAIIAGSVGLGVAFDFLIETAPASAGHTHETAGWWRLASAGVLLLLLGWFALDDVRHLLGRRRVARAVGGEQVIEVGVDGMSCGGCVSKLESALRSEQGVRAVSVSLETKKAVVRGDVDEARVRQAILRVGFKPTTI
jgi:uncharacterized membrane protein YraQ (UPF0718 family)/copper chaperone CopZ